MSEVYAVEIAYGYGGTVRKVGRVVPPSLIFIVAFGYVVKQAVIVNGIAVYRQCAARSARPTREK